MRSFFTLISVIYFTVSLFAQDTITVVQYNLTYYGRYTDFCTEDNNNVATKTDYLKTIVSYLEPDIFGINEITDDVAYHDYILNNVFILNGFENYKRSEVLGSYLTTQVFYNASKLVKQRVYTVYAYPRDIYIHRFYFRTSGLEQGDTVFLNIIEAHLKAGSTTENAQARADAVSNLMQFINSHGNDNFLFMGDLNLYTSSEQAYQYATSSSLSQYYFYDPVGPGNWHDNADFALYHTQSTNYYSDNCRSGGGLDDRFDFMLYTQPLKDGTQGIKALSETFSVVAQDGQHFNSAVDYQGNNTVPEEVLIALKNNSDHLPITMKLYLDAQPAYTNIETYSIQKAFSLINTFVQDELTINVNTNDLLWSQNVFYKVYDISGRIYKEGMFKVNGNQLNYTISGFAQMPAGIYFISFRWAGKVYTEKFVQF